MITIITEIVIIKYLMQFTDNISNLNSTIYLIEKTETTKTVISNNVKMVITLSEAIENDDSQSIDISNIDVISGLYKNDVSLNYTFGPKIINCSNYTMRNIFSPFFGFLINRGHNILVVNISKPIEGNSLIHGCIKTCVNIYGPSNPNWHNPISIMKCGVIDIKLVTNVDYTSTREELLKDQDEEKQLRFASFTLLITLIILLFVELLMFIIIKLEYKRSQKKLKVYPGLNNNHGSVASAKFKAIKNKKGEMRSISIVDTDFANSPSLS